MQIISESEHQFPHTLISYNAKKVLSRLQDAGFDAYLVGGGVRDLLSGLHPKDFDVATNATPEEVRKVFKNSRLIGRRFRLAHVYFGRDIVEVATFRGEVQYCDIDTGMIVRDNSYGTLEEDAKRRDFTVNALYYNSKDGTIVDYVAGMSDINDRIIRMIGDPELRYREDPVRMLRALRLAAKLDFSLEPETADPITHLAGLLQNVPAARLFDEVMKWFKSGKSYEAYKLLSQHGLFALLFPETEASLITSVNQEAGAMLEYGFKNTDARMKEQKPINPAFLLAVLLWWPLKKSLQKHQSKGQRLFPALYVAAHEVLKQQAKHIILPRYVVKMVREIWSLQFRLEQRKKRRLSSLMLQPRFRAAYDFLLLREQAGEHVAETAAWWTDEIAKSQQQS